MQTSFVMNQIRYPGVGRDDYDDCWVVSGLEGLHVTNPGARWPSATAVRAAAGDPDDGDRDGGTVGEIVRGVTTLWPEYQGELEALRNGTWRAFVGLAEAHRPISVAVVSSELPKRLRYGFEGFHQVTIAVKGSGQWLYANPLAPVYSRWDKITPDDIRRAIMQYGKAKTGAAGVWGVAFPDDATVHAWNLPDDDTPYDAEDLAEAVAGATAELEATNAELERRIADARAALEGDA